MANAGKAVRLKRVIDPETGTSVVCHNMTSRRFLDDPYDTRRRAWR